MSSVRGVEEGVQEIGSNERIIYTLTTTKAGGTPTAVSVTARLEDSLQDITSAIFPTNTPTVDGDVITLSPFTASVDYWNQRIRVDVKYTSAGNVIESYFVVQVEL